MSTANTTTTQQQMVPFEFNGHTLRILPTEDGLSFWAVANDACRILGLSNQRQALSRLDDDEKGVTTTDTLGGSQAANTVSESGLYALILTSRKSQARPFRRWVTSEVLPSIRRTGTYTQPGRAPADPDRLTEAKALLSEADRRLNAVQRVKREAKRALVENQSRDRELTALRDAYTSATAQIADLQREAQAARDLALAGHADLRRTLHYRRKDLDTHEIHLLTTLPEPAIEDLLTQATAAGFHPELTNDLDTVVQMARNGLVLLPQTTH